MDRKKGFPRLSNKGKGIAGCILLAAGIVLTFISRIFPAFAQWYSTHIYPIWVNVTGRVMGVFPFSVSEVLLYILIAAVILTFLILIVGNIRNVAKSDEKNIKGLKFRTWIINIYLLACALAFLYVVNCGINYHRKSFAESTGIQMEEYSAEQLKEVCLWLTDEVNLRSNQVKRDGNGIMRLPQREKGVAEESWNVNDKAVEAMRHLSEDYPELSGYYPKPKGLLFSRILSVQELTGIYSPFTVEANYNSDVVDYNIPFTACHELSHLKSFMQEEEANYIAFLASTGSEDIEFQYSGYVMGWKYCMNVLYTADYGAWEEVRGKLSEKVEPDLAANREFWSDYDGKVAEVANKVNDTYLKANNQEDGVKSYNKMVDLIVAQFGK